MHRVDESSSDAWLLAATVAGEREAFAVFYRRYVSRVAGLLMRQTRDREVTADLVAEVFAAVLLAAEKFRGDGPAWPWVCGVAQNKLKESWRHGKVEDRARRRLHLEPAALADEDLERIEAMGQETNVVELLEGLPERQRRAVQARVLDERNYADIAQELSCSELVVRQSVSRGLARLRSALEEAGS